MRVGKTTEPDLMMQHMVRLVLPFLSVSLSGELRFTLGVVSIGFYDHCVYVFRQTTSKSSKNSSSCSLKNNL